MIKPYGLHWFRRDLRLCANQALIENIKKFNGRVLFFFCFDPKFLKRNDIGQARFLFFIQTLQKLELEIKNKGGLFLFFDQGPEKAFSVLFNLLKRENKPLPSQISFSRDYEPFARERDKKLKTFFDNEGIEVCEKRDHLLIEPWELFKPDSPSEGYKVYTAFLRRWLELFDTPTIRHRLFEVEESLKKATRKTSFTFNITAKELFSKKLPTSSLEIYYKKIKQKVSISVKGAGFKEAFSKLNQFAPKINDYKTLRDIPSLNQTSKLAIYLKNGTLTPSIIISHLNLESFPLKQRDSRATFLSEIVWREFYYHLLYRHPHIEKKSFIPAFENIKWENNEAYFECWKEGQTGFPIVDAGMRQLKYEGWMHNRVRMIVASFLTKDLLIDWRWGEEYFMQTLLDGDLAPNNGGWQWAASTGCDAQPYFRIFNPWLQSKRYDPDGIYIKKYIPELEKLPSKLLHKPSKELAHYYFAPIVDHSYQKDKALTLYKRAKEAFIQK